MTLKGSGESFAQIAAEKANPEARRLVRRHRRPAPAGRRAGPDRGIQVAAARRSCSRGRRSRPSSRSTGPSASTSACSASATTPSCWRRRSSRRRPAGRDLIKPEYAGEVQMANPNASGTAYTAIATLVQVFGEEEAFKYLKALHKNINNYPRSGVAPIKAVARGETLRRRLVHPRRRHRGAGGLPGQERRALRGHRLRDRLAVDRQGRAQPRQREEVRRLGADAEGAGAGRAGEAVPDAVERRRAGVAAVAEDSPTSSSSTTTSPSTARRPSASACSSAGTAKSARSPSDGSSRIIAAGPCSRRRARHGVHRCCRSPPRRRCRSPPSLAAPPAQGQLNLYCSSPNTAWCQGMAVGFEKATGTKVAVDPEGHRRDARADQGRARESRRATSGGPARPTRTCRRPRKACSRPTGRRTSAQLLRLGAAHHRRVEEPRRRRLRRHPRARLQHRAHGEEEAAGAEVLEGPRSIPLYKGEVMLGNPNSSGTAYLMLASLVQVFGEDEAFTLHEGAERQRERSTRARASAR